MQQVFIYGILLKDDWANLKFDINKLDFDK